MKRLFGSLTAVIVVMLMVLGHVPEVGAVTTVPQNVQVPMPLPMYPRDPAFHIWAEDFINSFFPNRPDVSIFDMGIQRISPWTILCPLQPQLLRFHVLHDDDTLWAWGVNDRGVLGDGTSINRLTPVLILDNVFISHNIISSVALGNNGTLWTWGCGLFDTLGVYPRPSYLTSPTIVKDNIVSVTHSGAIIKALCQDGTVWTWGTGTRGQMGCGSYGVGSFGQVTHYTPISILDNVVQICSAAHGRFALKADNSLWAWGYHRSWRAYTPTMIVRNFIEPTEFPHTFTADDGTEFTLRGWAPQIPSSPFHTAPPTRPPTPQPTPHPLIGSWELDSVVNMQPERAFSEGIDFLSNGTGYRFGCSINGREPTHSIGTVQDPDGSTRQAWVSLSTKL